MDKELQRLIDKYGWDYAEDSESTTTKAYQSKQALLDYIANNYTPREKLVTKELKVCVCCTHCEHEDDGAYSCSEGRWVSEFCGNLVYHVYYDATKTWTLEALTCPDYELSAEITLE